VHRKLLKKFVIIKQSQKQLEHDHQQQRPQRFRRDSGIPLLQSKNQPTENPSSSSHVAHTSRTPGEKDAKLFQRPSLPEGGLLFDFDGTASAIRFQLLHF